MDIYPVSGLAPAIIVVHGGGWRGKDKLNPPIKNTAESLAADGFAVFNIDFRQAGRDQPGFPMMTDDLAAAAAWIQQYGGQYGADTADINFIGGSSGGQLVALAAQLIDVSAPGMIDKVVSLSGPMDFVEFNHPTDGTPPPADEDHPGADTYLGCLPSTCTADQEQLPSPYYNIDPATCPSMLMINSAEDKLVPVAGQPARMRDAMVAAGCQGTLTVVPGTEHGFKLFPEQHEEITAYFRGDPSSPPPTVSGVTPSAIGQGGAEQPVTIAGDGFTAGSTVEVSGSGVRLASQTFIDAQTLAVTMAVDRTAATGIRTVTVTVPGAGAASCSCLTVNAKPRVTTAEPGQLGTGASDQVLTMTGSGFTPDTEVAFTGGQGVKAVTHFVSTTTLSVSVSVNQTAHVGNYNIVVTNAYGANSPCSKCFTVIAGPAPASVTPNTLAPGSTTPVTISGDNFQTGAELVLPLGMTATDVSVMNTTTITAVLTVAPHRHPATGLSITVTNPDGGGAGSCNCLTITK